MAIYEFICKDCGRESEILVRGETLPVCEQCGGTKLEKRVSTFAVVGASSPGTGCACGGEQKHDCDCETQPVGAAGGCGCGGRCGGH